jgi:hypothetical protein
MRGPTSFVTGFLVLFALGSQVGAAGADSRDGQACLSEDQRLAKRIDLAERYVCLTDILQKVSDMTGVKLHAEGFIAGENVILMIRDRPAGEVLDLLAENLGYYWNSIHRGNTIEGYELCQDLVSRQREQRLHDLYRRLALAELEQELAIQWRYADIPKREGSLRHQQISEELRTEGLSQSQIEALQLERQRLSNAIFDDRALPLLTLYFQLSDSQRDRLMKGRVLRFSSAGHRRMERMPVEIARALVRARGMEEASQWYAEHPPTDVRADMRLKRTPSSVTLILRSQLVGPPPPGWDGKTDKPLRISRQLTMEKVDKNLVAMPTDISDPRLNKDISINIKPKRPVVEDPSTYVDHLTASDIIASIARQQTDLAFIGGTYLKPVRYPSQAHGAVANLVNQFASAAGYHWKFDRRGYVLLRSGTIFADRPRSIPASLLREVMRRSLKNDGLSLRDHAELAARLTDEQIEGLQDEDGRPLIFLWPRITTQALIQTPDDLRLIAALNSTQLDKLFKGEAMSYASLSIRQRAAYEQAIDTDALQYENDPIEVPSDEDLMQSAFRIVLKTSGPEQEVAQGLKADVFYFVSGSTVPVIARSLWIAQGDQAYKPKVTEGPVKE